MKRMIFAVVAVLALAGVAAAEDNWHSGAYDPQRGTNFADPVAYKRLVPHQGGGDGTAGEAGDSGAAASGSSGGSTGGNGGESGDCGPR